MLEISFLYKEDREAYPTHKFDLKHPNFTHPSNDGSCRDFVCEICKIWLMHHSDINHWIFSPRGTYGKILIYNKVLLENILK